MKMCEGCGGNSDIPIQCNFFYSQLEYLASPGLNRLCEGDSLFLLKHGDLPKRQCGYR